MNKTLKNCMTLILAAVALAAVAHLTPFGAWMHRLHGG